MASLTVRNIEDETKQRLRMRAAGNGRSLEDEVRHVLRDAAREAGVKKAKSGNLYEAIRELVEPHGGFKLELPSRQPGRRPVPFQDWK